MCARCVQYRGAERASASCSGRVRRLQLVRSRLTAAVLLVLLNVGCAGAAGDTIEDWSPLESGHGNWSAKQLKKNVKKLKGHDAVMVGFSAASCGNFCRQFEPVYAEFTQFLSAELPSIKFIRLDADKHKAIMAQYGVSTLPEIITLKKGHKSSVPYTGVHSEWSLRSFARKLAGPPIAQLETTAQVSTLLADNLNATVVTGFFRNEHRDSDEYEDWVEASKELSLRADIVLADLDERLHSTYRGKPHSWFEGSRSTGPTLVLHRPIEALAGDASHREVQRTEDDRVKVELETLTEGSIDRWVDSNRIPACGSLDPKTFEHYERLGLPMLLLFLSKDGDDPIALPTKAEREARNNFCTVARKYRRFVSFLYGDGKAKYREKKKVLGLHGDTLPAMAMNTADGRVLTYDEADFSELALESFVRRYLGEDVAVKTKGAERGPDSPKPPEPSNFGGEVVIGDAHADAFAEHVDNVTVLNTDNFHDVVMNPHKDVLVILQAHDSKNCQEFYKYVKRSADRFIDLGLSDTIEVTKFDVERYVVPGHIPIQYSSLPAVVMFPAKDKEPPYICAPKEIQQHMSGKAKAQHLMWFVQKHASFQFEFPNEDPHLTDEQYIMKQEQLKEREERTRQKKEEEEEESKQRRKKAEAADADGDGHDDCPWAEGCDDEDKKEL